MIIIIMLTNIKQAAMVKVRKGVIIIIKQCWQIKAG